jgi:hypothetical protein
MDRLVEGVLPGVRVTVGPDEIDQPFPAYSAAPRGSNDGEDCKTTSLGGWAEMKGPILLEEEPTEGDQSKHGLAADLRFCSGRLPLQSYVKKRHSAQNATVLDGLFSESLRLRSRFSSQPPGDRSEKPGQARQALECDAPLPYWEWLCASAGHWVC